MDLSLIMNTLMSADSLNNISKKTGSSQKEVKDVLVSALPLLLKGAQAQEEDESTAESFMSALTQHSKNDTSDLNSFFDGVDMADGAKIIGHLLGTSTASTTKKVSKSSGSSDDNTALILAAAAPLLMSLLGQETKKSKKSSKNDLTGQLLTAVLDNVDVGSLLMSALSTKAEEETTTKKKTTAKKATSTTKKTTAKKTTAKKTTAKKTTTAKKKAASTTKKTTTAKKTTKKKAASEDNGIDLGDAANLLMNLLK